MRQDAAKLTIAAEKWQVFFFTGGKEPSPDDTQALSILGKGMYTKFCLRFTRREETSIAIRWLVG